MISKTAVYAIRAMLALVKLPTGTCLGAPKIAELVQAPPSYLSKLLQTLVHAGLIHSQRGVAGGFSLARGPAAISLYDIVEPLDPVERWSGCLLGNSECSDAAACPIHERWKEVQQAYLGMLRQSTLAELVDREGRTPNEAPLESSGLRRLTIGKS